MRPFTIKLPKHLDDRLSQLAREHGVARAEIVRRAIGAYGSRSKLSALELLGDLVGSVRGGPPDLSTNPKYLEGFGEYRSPRRKRHRRST